MITAGTRIIIEGVPYLVQSATQGRTGAYVLVCHYDTGSIATGLRESIAVLMDKLASEPDLFVISHEIIGWFLDEKLKAGLNVNQILRIKNKPSYAEAQIRRLMKNGEDIQEIVEVLAFAISDSFWSGVLNTSINTIAVPKSDGLMLYQKIKSKMIAQRANGVTEIYQPTDDDLAGIIITE